MKIAAAYFSDNSPLESRMKVIFWPDSAMIRTGKPVFIPDDDAYYVMPGYAVKIESVGKTIVPKFAQRYYREILPMAFIVPESVAQKIHSRQDPPGCDFVADYSVIAGNPLPATDSFNVKLEISRLPGAQEETEEFKQEYTLNSLLGLFNGVIEAASLRNTLKTGDFAAYIFPQAFPANPDTLLRVTLNGSVALENKLK